MIRSFLKVESAQREAEKQANAIGSAAVDVRAQNASHSKELSEATKKIGELERKLKDENRELRQITEQVNFPVFYLF